MAGKEIWLREWKPRFKHNNRQAEPYLVGDTILYVEGASKEHGAKIQKWAAPGKKSKSTAVPEGVDPKEVGPIYMGSTNGPVRFCGGRMSGL